MPSVMETFGKCKCGEFNALSAVVCHGCGARLPWVNGPRGAKTGRSGTGHSVAAPTRAQMAQAGYWDTALTGTKPAGASTISYGNDPDIDFTPFGATALGGATTSASASTRDADMYCSRCGAGLKAGQTICRSCRHMVNFTVADLRFSVLVSTLVVTGFVLGAVWCAVLLNYFHTGSWQTPYVTFSGQAKTATKDKPLPKDAIRPKATLPPPQYYGTPKQ